MKVYEINKQQSNFHNPFDSNQIMKRDFFLLLAYFVGMQVVIAIFVVPYMIISTLKQQTVNHTTELFLQSAGSLAGEFLVLLVFYLMHRKYILPIAKARFKQVKDYKWTLIITYIVVLVGQAVYSGLMTLLPKSLQFNDTQNQMALLEMFHNPIAWPILFLDIVIVTPFVEELLFRHLIIHELGKKIGYTFAAILSIILFAGIHVIGAKSPFEIGVYIIIASGVVYVYMKSKQNLAVSISFHMLVNGISFIGIIAQYLTKYIFH